MKWFGWICALLCATAAGATVTGFVAFQYFVGSRAALPGTLVWGHRYDPAVHGEPGAWLELRQRQLASHRLYLKASDSVQEYSLAELGIELDVPAALSALSETAHQGSTWERLVRALTAKRGLLVQPIEFSFDRERARATLEKLAAHVYQPAIDAKLDLANHRRVESQNGRALDIQGTLDALEQALLTPRELEQGAVVSLRYLELLPAVTSDMIADIDVSKVLASFETSFKNKAGMRALNIRKAAEYLDGTILAPGATLSFNDVVGPREEHRGFVWAPVIVNDEMEPGVGGGVCQVATTLHAAAVYGLLEVIERRSHSRPSGYAPLGLDAAVIYGKVNLKLRNPYDTALMIHAHLPGNDLIRIEFLGREPPGKVQHTYAVIEKHDFVRRVSQKSFLEAGTHERRQRGGFGYDILSIVHIEYPDGREARRTYKSKYYPVPEVYWVAEGSDLSELPELPEGATHTEHSDDMSLGDMAGSEHTSGV